MFDMILNASLFVVDVEAIIRRCSVKKMFLKISQNSQENSFVGVAFQIKLPMF